MEPARLSAEFIERINDAVLKDHFHRFTFCLGVNDKTVLDYGKLAGNSFLDIYCNHPSYTLWLFAERKKAQDIMFKTSTDLEARCKSAKFLGMTQPYANYCYGQAALSGAF